MSTIPIIDLPLIHKRLSGHSSDQKYLLHRFTSDNPPIWDACRMDAYFIALLHKGTALIETDLTKESVEGPSVFTMSPAVIRKFLTASEDFSSEVIFFDKAFFLKNLSDQTYLDRYKFFNNSGDHVTAIDKAQYRDFKNYFKLLANLDTRPPKYAEEIARNIIQILLTEIASVNINTNKQIGLGFREYHTSIFKQNLESHFQKHRKVIFYADLQNLSSRYFSNIIRKITGKSAGAWIDERVILEAKALLNNKALTIAQISSILNFDDPSNFGKYFKHLTGLSPLHYRKTVSG